MASDPSSNIHVKLTLLEAPAPYSSSRRTECVTDLSGLWYILRVLHGLDPESQNHWHHLLCGLYLPVVLSSFGAAGGRSTHPGLCPQGLLSGCQTGPCLGPLLCNVIKWLVVFVAHIMCPIVQSYFRNQYPWICVNLNITCKEHIIVPHVRYQITSRWEEETPKL